MHEPAMLMTLNLHFETLSFYSLQCSLRTFVAIFNSEVLSLNREYMSSLPVDEVVTREYISHQLIAMVMSIAFNCNGVCQKLLQIFFG